MSAEAENVIQGMVLYTDGGARPNPGFTGWGIHGYKYSIEQQIKGTGLSDQVFTDEGYISKFAFNEGVEKGKDFVIVRPLQYIDSVGNLSFSATNNVAELTAAIEGIRFATKHDITKLRIIADSEYVVRGTNEYLDLWRVNGWVRQDRTPIANKELWEKLDSVISSAIAKGIDVTLAWIKGHNGFFGNEKADHYATVGILKARDGVHVNSIETSEADGYWKYKVERHPFISHRRMYFNTLLDYQVPGHYYLGEHGKDDDLLGKKSSDGAFAFIAINQPDQTLEMVRKHQSNIANNSDTFIMARLDYIFNPTNHKELNEFGKYSLVQSNQYRMDLFGLGEEPVTRELRPAKLAIRAIEALSDLSERLDQFFTLGSENIYTHNDITDSFFDITEIVNKKSKEVSRVFKLKNCIGVGVTSIDVNAKYDFNGEVKEMPLSLAFGIDLPNRNSIKHMENLQPKVFLITWKESDKSFRYATVISTDTDKGIWAGVYSNLVVIK